MIDDDNNFLQFLEYFLKVIIIFIMAEYFHQYGNQNLGGGKPPQNLQHYRIQIKKLQQRLRQTKQQYQKKIQSLQRQLKNHRKPIFQNGAGSKQSIDLDFQIYQRDNTIKQLRNENTKLRQIVNNPDHILIKKPNNFQLIAEKDNEINRLKKALLQIQSRYDGQFFNEHKVKKQYEMLEKQNEALKLHLRNLQGERKFHSNNNELPMQALEAISYKKQLQLANKDIEAMRKMLNERAMPPNNKRNGDSSPGGLGSSGRSSGFGLGTEIQALKKQMEQFKKKNRQLKKQVDQLQNENSKLLAEKALKFSSQQTKVQPNKAKVIVNNNNPYQFIVSAYQNVNGQQIGGNNLGQATAKKNGRYAELGFDDNYKKRFKTGQKGDNEG